MMLTDDGGCVVRTFCECGRVYWQWLLLWELSNPVLSERCGFQRLPLNRESRGGECGG